MEAPVGLGGISQQHHYQVVLPTFVPDDTTVTTFYDPTVGSNGTFQPVIFPDGFPPTDTPSTANSNFDDSSTQQSAFTTATSFSPGQSPRLIDLLLPGSDLTTRPPPEYVDFKGEPEYRPERFDSGQTPTGNGPLGIEDTIEEIPRYCDQSESWLMRLPSPSLSNSSGSSEGSMLGPICWGPRWLHGSPEMLLSKFDKQTCGILSVKDGPNENPWRTMVWPLAVESPALYHAISSMTAFHSSKEAPELRVHGIDHMRHSLEYLASEIESMRTDTALATTLVLAFSESWDQHISTGIEHLRGAKVLVKRALTDHRRNALSLEELDRFRFLCNTWVYMDVIARLTSVDDDDSHDFDAALMPTCGPFGRSQEIDPLMGCASTLFPLIGRVANLVRKVMKCPSNTVNIVSQANELKVAIEDWEPPASFEPPEDPTSEIQHSLQTAEAYRWATLLYLHQAVPEVPSMTAEQLAKKVLLLLATVPLSSRAVIVQIYPLLAAGCEAVGHEDRAWVEDRWASMVRRMAIGNLDRCWEVIKEVWDRRDADDAERCRQMHRRTFSPTERIRRRPDMNAQASMELPGSHGLAKSRAESFSAFARPPKLGKRSTDILEYIDFEKTVRGRLHWVGVMKDWNWEGETLILLTRETTDFVKVLLG